MANKALILSPVGINGKTHRDENFPVASFMLPRSVRQPVMAFYHFARTADDVADSPELSPEQKLIRLDQMGQALHGNCHCHAPHAFALRQTVQGQLQLLDYAHQLLDAFRRDVMVDQCHDWADLMAYCQCSAMPVGRFLLELHGESPQTYHASDCLCAALQILNHLQDCAADYQMLNRVYLPQDWLRMEGLEGQCLCEDSSGPELRRVLDKTLDHVDGLIDLARSLPSAIVNRGLRMETLTILHLASHLAGLLRQQDPLRHKVRISPFSFAWAMVKGTVGGYLMPL